MTTYYMGGRRSGKTLRLIVLSEATRTPILVSNKKRAECLIDQAKRMGFDIPEPLTLHDYMNSNKFVGRRDISENGIYIDNVDDVVKELFKDIPIKAVTFDKPDDFVELRDPPTPNFAKSVDKLRKSLGLNPITQRSDTLREFKVTFELNKPSNFNKYITKVRADSEETAIRIAKNSFLKCNNPIFPSPSYTVEEREKAIHRITVEELNITPEERAELFLEYLEDACDLKLFEWQKGFIKNHLVDMISKERKR